MTVDTEQWLFQDRLVRARWGWAVHAAMVQTGTADVLTLCGRQVASDADPMRPSRPCRTCFPPVDARS